MKNILRILGPVFVFVVFFSSGAGLRAETVFDDIEFRTFKSDDTIEYGDIADSFTADLVMYVAIEQYNVMEELVRGFMAENPSINTVFVATMPDGQLLNEHMLKQGQIKGISTSRNPDVYITLGMEKLQSLHTVGKLDRYMTYAHDALELMVAKDNPKGIVQLADLLGTDIKIALPNPLTEGAYRYYISEMLQEEGIYASLITDESCSDCWINGGKIWFSGNHYREIPALVENGTVDVGIVWTSEILRAFGDELAVEGVPLHPHQNKGEKAQYILGLMKGGKNSPDAEAFALYLGTKRAQFILTKYGFVPATDAELALKVF